ncbi:MAG: hypothetical protein ACJ749_14375 [Flavisolibacter sp.]
MKTSLLNINVMKRIVPVVAIAAMLTACNSSPKPEVQGSQTTTTVGSDTAGLAQFQQWKAQNELATTNQYGQTTTQSAAPQTKVVYVPQKTRTVYRNTSSGSSGSMSSTSSGAAKKRGWSKAAKGATIGGVAGAVGGAVINKKNRVAGGVIGGILGAGVGYGIGRSKDKKDGRY